MCVCVCVLRSYIYFLRFAVAFNSPSNRVGWEEEKLRTDFYWQIGSVKWHCRCCCFSVEVALFFFSSSAIRSFLFALSLSCNALWYSLFGLAFMAHSPYINFDSYNLFICLLFQNSPLRFKMGFCIIRSSFVDRVLTRNENEKTFGFQCIF